MFIQFEFIKEVRDLLFSLYVTQSHGGLLPLSIPPPLLFSFFFLFFLFLYFFNIFKIQVKRYIFYTFESFSFWRYNGACFTDFFFFLFLFRSQITQDCVKEEESLSKRQKSKEKRKCVFIYADNICSG